MSVKAEVVDVSSTLQKSKSKFKPATASKEDDLSYDLGNLFAYDPHNSVANNEGDIDEQLQMEARENAQLLFNRLFQLPVVKVDGDFLAELPKKTTVVPREKPIPKPRIETKWESYARTKGIKNQKKGRMVWDEPTNSWKPRFGYKRANDDLADWLIPAKSNDSLGSDPWEQRGNAKKERISKQNVREKANLKREKVTNDGILGKLMSQPGDERRKREKGAIEKDVNRIRKSTASIGKFEDLLPKEKTGKRSRQQFESVTGSGEKERNKKVLDRLLEKKKGVDVAKVVKQFNKDPNFRRNVSSQTPPAKRKKRS